MEAPLEQKRPFAQLTGQDLIDSQGLTPVFISDVCGDGVFAPYVLAVGSSTHAGENNVVQWEYKRDDTSLHHMGYSKGRLLVQMEGHYYLYSKLTWNAAEECSLVQHKVMKVTKAYDQPIELMKSKRLAPVQHPPCRPFWSVGSGTVLLLSVIHVSFMFPLVFAVPQIQKIQLLNLQLRRIYGTASWLGFSTCNVAMKFTSLWTKSGSSSEDRLTTWEPL